MIPMDEQEHYLNLVKSIYESAKSCVCDRLAGITFHQDLFSVKEKIKDNTEPWLSVCYDGNAYLNIIPYRKNYRNSKGSTCCRGHITLKRKNDAAWYGEGYKTINVYVNEYQVWEVDHKIYDTENFLKHFFPVGDEQNIEVIKNDLADLGVSSKEGISPLQRKVLTY